MNKYEFQKKSFVKFDENNIFMISGDIEDPITAFKKACREAEAAGWKGFAWEVPKKYRENQGISVKRIEIHSMPAYIGKKRAGEFRYCCANECSAYDGGTCWRYGGTCCGRYTGDDLDCIHGTGGKLLTYLGDVVANVPVETDLSPKQFAREIWTGTDTGILKDGIRGILEAYPYALDGYPEDICWGTWDFKDDD